jgi:hypothetical protein
MNYEFRDVFQIQSVLKSGPFFHTDIHTHSHTHTHLKNIGYRPNIQTEIIAENISFRKTAITPKVEKQTLIFQLI